MFYGSQFAYDNAEEPWRDDSLDEEVKEALTADFDKDFLTYEFSDKLVSLFLKVCKKTASLDDFVEFKKESSDWYETELERYQDGNFERKEKEIIEHHNSI